MLAQLIPVNGGQPLTLDKDISVVGRSKDACDLYLSSNSISKIHCVLIKTDGLLFIRDLNSTNGIKVNGQRVVRGALLPGDKLTFANLHFRVHLGPDDPSMISPHDRTEAIDLNKVNKGIIEYDQFAESKDEL